MNIHFQKIRYKNFLASGNNFIEIVLDQAATTLILGVNGTGKSTLLDAICFVLFKQTFRKLRLAEIVNEINNGDCVVEIEFEVGGRQYLVRRGLEPAFFEILIDGETRPQEAAKKDDQKFLEEDVLKVDYDAFIQVVILGNAKYTPFMQLKPQPRRDFIEHVLDIGVFSVMNDILKERQKDLTKELAVIGNDIVVSNEQIVLIRGFISKLEAEQQKASKELQTQIDDAVDKSALCDVEWAELEEEKQGLAATLIDESDVKKRVAALQSAKVTHTSTTKTEIQTRQNSIDHSRQTTESIVNQKRKSYNAKEGICAACRQSVTHDHIQSIKDGIEREIEALLKTDTETRSKLEAEIATIKEQSMVRYNTIKADLDAALQEASELEAANQTAKDAITEITAKQRELSIQKKNFEQNIKRWTVELNKESGNIQEETNKLASVEAKLKRLEGNKKAGLDTGKYYEAAAVMLKDTGIKSAIIRQYLPAINKLVNKYLNALDFFVTFTLDENFNETIKSRGRDNRVYTSFSQGEKLRMDLALLFTWREIAHAKSSCSTNLLILDEVIDGSMDSNGTDLFIKLLNEHLTGSNVFVISHKNDAALDKFQATLRFARDKNFSKLIQEM